LSETSTQETTKNTLKSVSERREQEKQRCPEGFSRVGGNCERNPAPVSEAEPAAPPSPPEHAPKKTKKPKVSVIEQKPEQKAKSKAAAKIVRRAPPPPPPPVLAPVPIEPPVRYASWAQVFEDISC